MTALRFCRSMWPLLAGAALLTTSLAWGRPSSAHRPVSLTDIHMITSSTGWALTRNGVLRTGDGGRVWDQVLEIPHSSVGFAGNQGGLATFGRTHAWIAVNAGSSQTVSIRYTSDSGATWHVSAPLPKKPRDGLVYSLQFVNARRGWLMLLGNGAAGSIGHALLRTSDGGAHWRIVEENEFPGQPRHALPTCDFVADTRFHSWSQGWATGECDDTGTRYVYSTSDGGRNWYRHLLPPPTPGQCVKRVSCSGYFASYPPVFSGRDGELAAGFSPPWSFVVYQTTNGGNAWHATTPLKSVQQPFGAKPISFALAPRRVWVLLGSDLYATADAGHSWSMARKRPGLGPAPQMQFINAADGFVVGGGDRPFIHVTTDGGRKWRKLYTVLS